MKISKSAIGAIALLSIASSCTYNKQSSSTKITETNTQTYVLIGKKAVLTYPKLRAEVEYIDENTLHWSQATADGSKIEGTEKVSYKQINNHQFFLNWIEADGFTVSQVIDLKTNKVTAYLSYGDENSERGGRTADFAEGMFEFIK
ncbi:MoaF-related domain-containing protein [Sphingobacterium sp. LRF_L2]|uniref:MoaF-related domain-containing protein n=1 Tax=Sphingobacterium sp. LRF_L2 TaxID=3369421 RepID=UPI003F60C93D